MTDWSQFEVGTRVRLVRWAPAAVDDHGSVPAGTEGVVYGHGRDQLWVKWDNGSTLSPVGNDVVERA